MDRREHLVKLLLQYKMMANALLYDSGFTKVKFDEIVVNSMKDLKLFNDVLITMKITNDLNFSHMYSILQSYQDTFRQLLPLIE